jgi:hypothetical protein
MSSQQLSVPPNLGQTSGDEKYLIDTNSLASISQKMQVLNDQIVADSSNDTKVKKKKEGFRNEIFNPWILEPNLCRTDTSGKETIGYLGLIILMGIILYNMRRVKYKF